MTSRPQASTAVPPLLALRRHGAAALYGMGWTAVRRLPEEKAYTYFEDLADLSWRRQGKSVQRLEANLRRVLGESASQRELRLLSRDGMRSYFRYWCELFRLPEWDAERVVSTVVVDGEHHLRMALAAGDGIVCALPHMGNWDHVGAWACLTGVPLTTVAERLEPESLFRRFVAVRERLGMEVLPLTGTGDLVSILSARLREGRAVCLLADRDLRATGIPVEFFGEQASMPPGPALLSVLTGAPLHPVWTSYLPDDDAPGRARLHVSIGERIAVPATGATRAKVSSMTQALAYAFQTAISAHPADWHMLQRLWLADLPQGRG